jgi:predicted DNA binding CopG/RHH family protein
MSLQEIKVARKDVLKIVQENKEKHDGILKTAIEGYWIDAESYLKKYEKEELEKALKNHKAQLKRCRKEHKEFVKSVKTRIKEDLEKVKSRTRDKGFNYWRGAFPEDHGDDYLGTIRRLELCVEPEIELNNNEFDAYIRNKWTWKESFVTSNRGYVTSCAAVWVSGSVLGNAYQSNAISSSYAMPWSGTGSVAALASF